MSTTQEILDEGVRGSEQNTETMRRALQIVQDTQQVQAATMDTLNVQGNQLRRVAGDLEEVHEGVDEAEEVLEQMKCCGFLRSNKAKRRKPRSPKPRAPPAVPVEPVQNGSHAPTQTAQVPSGPATVQRKETGSHDGAYAQIEAERQAQDDYLTMIDKTLDAVKEGAKDMGTELDVQNRYLENIQGQAQAVQDRVGGVNQHAVIRRHVK